jgi:hypothetical protein
LPITRRRRRCSCLTSRTRNTSPSRPGRRPSSTIGGQLPQPLESATVQPCVEFGPSFVPRLTTYPALRPQLSRPTCRLTQYFDARALKHMVSLGRTLAPRPSPLARTRNSRTARPLRLGRGRPISRRFGLRRPVWPRPPVSGRRRQLCRACVARPVHARRTANAIPEPDGSGRREPPAALLGARSADRIRDEARRRRRMSAGPAGFLGLADRTRVGGGGEGEINRRRSDRRAVGVIGERGPLIRYARLFADRPASLARYMMPRLALTSRSSVLTTPFRGCQRPCSAARRVRAGARAKGGGRISIAFRRASSRRPNRDFKRASKGPSARRSSSHPPPQRYEHHSDRCVALDQRSTRGELLT